MDPFTIAAAVGLMLGSTYFKQRALKQQSARINELAAAERLRQEQFDTQRMADINKTLPQFTSNAQQASQQSIAQKLETMFRGAQDSNPPSNIYANQNPGAPAEIKERKDAAVAAATAKGKDYADRLADLSAYNMLNFNTGVTLGRLGERQAETTTSQRRSADIFPMEVDAVPHYVGRKDMTIGEIMGGAANIAAIAGAKGGAPTEFGPTSLGKGPVPVNPFG